jgi:hypothetical protein
MIELYQWVFTKQLSNFLRSKLTYHRMDYVISSQPYILNMPPTLRILYTIQYCNTVMRRSSAMSLSRSEVFPSYYDSTMIIYNVKGVLTTKGLL